MPKFYINKNQQPSGDYEVHQEDICPTPALPKNRIILGNFIHCRFAIAEAKKKFPNVAKNIDGCKWCARPCHTK